MDFYEMLVSELNYFNADKGLFGNIIEYQIKHMFRDVLAVFCDL